MTDIIEKTADAENISSKNSDSDAKENKAFKVEAPKGFEEFDLDDIEVIESKVFA